MKFGDIGSNKKLDIFDKRKGKKKKYNVESSLKTIMGGALVAGGLSTFTKVLQDI